MANKPMTNGLLETPLHDWHETHGGRMVDFAGWSMPVQYTSIIEEHTAVRSAAGLFDISHMGRLRFSGAQRVALLQSITTNDVAALEEGQVQYSLVTNEQGGILDDVLVSRFGDFHLLVCNASNRVKVVQWIERHREGLSAEFSDETNASCMIAIQGPLAAETLQPLVQVDLSTLRYYRAAESEVVGTRAIVSRTGYTGEDGFEVITASERAVTCWEALLDEGRNSGLRVAGLGARDTLRLEAAMPLYGHELCEETDPLQAGLGFAVKLDRGEFCGRDALRAVSGDSSRPVRAGFELQGRRIARQGCSIVAGGKPVGEVTSGTFSPTLEKSIAMGYVGPDHAGVGNTVAVDIRGREVPATVVKLPFYKRPRKRTKSSA